MLKIGVKFFLTLALNQFADACNAIIMGLDKNTHTSHAVIKVADVLSVLAMWYIHDMM